MCVIFRAFLEVEVTEVGVVYVVEVAIESFVGSEKNSTIIRKCSKKIK